MWKKDRFTSLEKTPSPRRLNTRPRSLLERQSLVHKMEFIVKALPLLFVVATLVACSDRPAAADAAAPAQDRAATTPPPTEPMPAQGAAAPATAPTPADNAPEEASYLGRWTGVEGMYLVVASKPGGGVTLDMQWDLDNKGTFDGSVTAEGLRFMRNGVAESALHTDGNATGLKYLAGKQDCLTVKPGEGYCKD